QKEWAFRLCLKLPPVVEGKECVQYTRKKIFAMHGILPGRKLQRPLVMMGCIWKNLFWNLVILRSRLWETVQEGHVIYLKGIAQFNVVTRNLQKKLHLLS